MTLILKLLTGLLFISILGTCSTESRLEDGENYIKTENGKIWYRIIGNGSEIPILTLHGGPGGKSRYFYSISSISDERPLIIFDQLGSGRSDFHEDSSILKIENFITQVDMIKKSVDLKDFYLLGQSWGSALALEYYLKYPDGIKGLIFSGPFFSTSIWEQDADTLISSLNDSIQNIIRVSEETGSFNTKAYKYADSIYWATFGRRHPWPRHTLDTAEALSNSFIYNYMWGASEFTALGTLKDYDNHKSLEKITIPTLFIAGEYDEARQGSVNYFQTLVPDSEVVFIDDAGHSSMTDNPEAYLNALRSFIRGIETK